jgi:hypothetical protein
VRWEGRPTMSDLYGQDRRVSSSSSSDMGSDGSPITAPAHCSPEPRRPPALLLCLGLLAFWDTWPVKNTNQRGHDGLVLVHISFLILWTPGLLGHRANANKAAQLCRWRCWCACRVHGVRILPPAGGATESARRRQCKGAASAGSPGARTWDPAAGGHRRRSGEPRRAAWTAFEIPSGWTVFQIPSTPGCL